MERFETHVRYHPWYEHWHRYHFIKTLLKGKKVCDVACGEGYGSALLAASAASVTGVDIELATVNRATKKYAEIDNLQYLQANALQLPFDDHQFDVVVSFETLEHMLEHQELLKELKRILKTDGVLIISTPDKHVYSADDDHNKYHLKELSKEEFAQLINTQFSHSHTFGQQFQLMSVIEDLSNNNHSNHNQHLYVDQGDENTAAINQSDATYLISFCSDEASSLLPFQSLSWHAFCDSQNALFHHYSEQIKRLMEIDKHNHELRETVEKQSAIIDHLKARLGY